MAVLGRSREQRRYDREQNRLVREANTSLSRDPDKLFKQWQQAGWVTKSVSSFDELVAQYNNLVSQGESPAKAREALIDPKAGKNIFGPVDPETGLAKLDRRSVRTRTAPATRQLADQQFGAGGGDQFEANVRDQFDRTGNRGGEMRAKARMAHNNVANPDYAGQIQYDLGHYRAAAHPDGAGYDGPMNMDPEPSYINQSHIDKDRIPQNAMREYGVPLNGPEAVAETTIQQRGAPSRSGLMTRDGHLPQPVLDDLSTSAYRQAFETAKANGELTGRYGGVMSIKKDPSIYKNWDTGLDLGPENYGNIKSYGQALALADKAEQLGQQGANIRPALDQLSPTTSKGTAVAQSGPVRRIAPAAIPYKNPAPLTAKQISEFQAGGGQAAMIRDGLTKEQIIARGRALLNPKPPKPPKATVKPAAKPTSKPTSKPTIKPAAKPRLRFRSAIPEPTPRAARRDAAAQLTRIVNSTNDVIRIVPGEWLPGSEGV
jgi:hypothetical protein